MDLSQPIFATPAPVGPAPSASRVPLAPIEPPAATLKPRLGRAPLKRDPFSRPALSPFSSARTPGRTPLIIDPAKPSPVAPPSEPPAVVPVKPSIVSPPPAVRGMAPARPSMASPVVPPRPPVPPLLPSRPHRAALQASPFSRVTRSGNSRAASSAGALIGRIGSPTTQDYSIRSPSRRARSWSSRGPRPPQLAPLSERFWFIRVIRSGRSPSPTTATAPNGNVLPAPIPLSAIPARSTPARLSCCPRVVAPKPPNPPDSSARLLRARHTVPSSAAPPTICPFGLVASP